MPRSIHHRLAKVRVVFVGAYFINVVTTSGGATAYTIATAGYGLSLNRSEQVLKYPRFFFSNNKIDDIQTKVLSVSANANATVFEGLYGLSEEPFRTLFTTLVTSAFPISETK